MTEELTVFDRWDQFMYLLAAQPRRQIIASLMETPEGNRLPLPDAALTPDVPVDRKRYEITLREQHLPMLADVNYVRWTVDPFQVQRGDRFDEPAAVMPVLLSADSQLPSALVAGCVEESR